MIRILLAAGALGAGIAVCGGIAPGEAGPICMSSGSKDAGAEGDVAVRTFTDKAGRTQTVYILQLPLPVCLAGPDKKDNIAEARSIELDASDPSVRQTIADHVGKEILVIGRPSGARTAHHHAPIVMDVVRTITE